jgi:hypothetical protein
MPRPLVRTLAALVLAWSALAPGTAPADPILISVTNEQPAGGFAFTPVWFGVHDGTFDLFDPGGPASPALEAVAELGDTGPLMTAFAGRGPQTTLASGNALPPFLPGQTAATVLDVASPGVRRYLSFASMVVPSNDLFVGNPNPLALPLFDAAGAFLGPRTIQVFGRMVWDAGTEVNAITDGGAFLVGVDATQGTPENGLARLFFDDPAAGGYLTSILGRPTPAGATSRAFGPDDLIATIRVTAVPEPSTIVLAALGLGALALPALRRRPRR